MRDTIYREDAIEAVKGNSYANDDYIEINGYGAINDISAIPSADRPQGEWIAKDGVFYCSCCGNDSAELSEDDVYVYEVPLPNYCQDCGARMKGAV